MTNIDHLASYKKQELKENMGHSTQQETNWHACIPIYTEHSVGQDIQSGVTETRLINF